MDVTSAKFGQLQFETMNGIETTVAHLQFQALHPEKGLPVNKIMCTFGHILKCADAR